MHVRNGVDTHVARYDTAHGMPHLDLVSLSGHLRSKKMLPHLSFDKAMTQAIEDFKRNYEKYIRAQG